MKEQFTNTITEEVRADKVEVKALIEGVRELISGKDHHSITAALLVVLHEDCVKTLKKEAEIRMEKGDQVPNGYARAITLGVFDIELKASVNLEKMFMAMAKDLAEKGECDCEGCKNNCGSDKPDSL